VLSYGIPEHKVDDDKCLCLPKDLREQPSHALPVMLKQPIPCAQSQIQNLICSIYWNYLPNWTQITPRKVFNLNRTSTPAKHITLLKSINLSINQGSITSSSLTTEMSSHAGASPLEQNLGSNATPSSVENIENIIKKPTKPKPPAKHSFYRPSYFVTTLLPRIHSPPKCLVFRPCG
jgi:hypothetical protein